MSKRLLAMFTGLMSVPSDNPRLLKAQFLALSRDLPMMYFVLMVNTWALAFTHWATAPWWLTLAGPVALTYICATRSVAWWRLADKPPTEAVIEAMLRKTNRLAVFRAMGFTAWSLALYPYGGPHAQAHVAFSMGITLVVCIFCMMHLLPASLITTLVVDIALVVFFGFSKNPTFIATAVSVVLVSLAMLVVLLNNYRTFIRLIDVQARTEELGEENLRLANQDSLTGLPNRRLFFSTLEKALALAYTQGTPLAVGILDLDGFKPINDLYGHRVGDKLLALVGQRLQPLESPTVHVARLGGDEFAFIIKGNLDDNALQAFGNDVCRQLQAGFTPDGLNIHIGATFGVATYPHTAANASQLYEFADYALYQGKRENPGSVCVFSTAHHEQLHEDAVTEQALRRADLDTELYVRFQPIVDAGTGQTVAFEALARWRSPELGEVSPGRFIPVAERAGLIHTLTLPLLHRALERARAWPQAVRLSFNLSAHDCASHESVQQILDIITNSGFAPSRLDLEITETAILQDVGQMQRAIQDFRQLGCGISLDDFGTGYSSLSQLHALALTKLKIDRSFITGIQNNPRSYNIVKSLIALTQDMRLECIVEGVETELEMAALAKLGCTLVQGFLFSRPLLFEDTLVWLDAAPAAMSPHRRGSGDCLVEGMKGPVHVQQRS